MTHMSTVSKMSGWKRLLTVEPALVRGVVGAIVSIALIWGVDFTGLGEQISQTADIVGGLVVLLTAWWTRSAVTPAALVVEEVKPDGTTVAGPASPLPTGQVITRD
jgi:hypothetical protein